MKSIKKAKKRISKANEIVRNYKATLLSRLEYLRDNGDDIEYVRGLNDVLEVIYGKDHDKKAWLLKGNLYTYVELRRVDCRATELRELETAL